MNRILLIIPFVLCLLQGATAQDEAVFMHYQINPMLINPAAAGFSDAYQLHLNARAQWTGFEGSPRTVGGFFNAPVGPTFGIGVGLISETAAQMTRLKGQLNAAFRFRIGDDWKIALGPMFEVQQLRVDNSATNSPFFDPGDIVLDDFLGGRSRLDAALGFRGTFRENTFAGLTFNNLVRSRLESISGVESNSSFLSFYTFNFGHRFEIEDLKMSLEPSLMLRQIKDTPFTVDFNVMAGFMDDQLMAGMSYRSLGALGLLLGTKLPMFNLYYSYDVSFQRFQQFNSGSHEVTLAFSFKKKSGTANNAQ